VSGLAGFTSQPDFLYRRSFEGELVREIGHGFVVHGGYRYIDFPSAIVTIIQPGASWYYRRGDVQVRGVLVHHGDTDQRSSAVIARTTFDLSRRVRVGGGVAVGNRIFDVSALARTQQGWAGFGNVRVAVAPHWFVTAGIGAAHEDPVFSQRTVSAAVRRTF
jgi:YaiO family outer membrane protein